MKKFICVRGWKRNPTGDVIEEWEYNKLPDEVKNRNFKEYVPLETAPPLEKEVVVVTPPVNPTPSRFKPFKVEDIESKDEEG